MKRAAIVAAICALEPIAHACKPVAYRDGVGRPTFDGDAKIVDEQLAPIECDGERCHVDTTYEIEAAADAKLAVAISGRGELAVDLDGQALDTSNLPTLGSLTWGLRTRTFRHALAAGPHTLRVRATIELNVVGTCTSPGILARHPYFGSGHGRKQTRMVIEQSPDGAQRPIVKLPDDWELDIGELEKTTVEDPDDTDPDRRRESVDRRIWLTSPPTFLHGGPFLMAGVTSGPGNLPRFRGGWEVARYPNPVFAVLAESDGGELVNTGFTVEAITPALIIPLTFSAGAGALLRVHPDVQPGLRTMLSIGFGPARIALTVDAMIPMQEAQRFALPVGFLFGLSL